VTPEPCAIRPAIPADLPAICAIYNHEVVATVHTFETEPWRPAARRSWLARHANPAYPLLVAEDASAAVVGWAGLQRWSPKKGYDGAVEASIFVAADQRRRGIGGQLLQAIVARAREVGHRVILGRIEATNEPSRALLARHGFATVGVMHAVGWKFGRVLDVELVELVLALRETGDSG
jgi:phosphinothricin acetyltransferase